jgi:D-alanine-D-alanine ligase
VNDNNGFEKKSVRVGVVFGGRSSEHEVSLASAANVIDALTRAGHQVVPIGITPTGRWLVEGDPMKLLGDNAALTPHRELGAVAQHNAHHAAGNH